MRFYDSEIKVLEVLWEHGELTAGQMPLMEKRLVYLILGVLFYEIKDNINGDCIDFRL